MDKLFGTWPWLTAIFTAFGIIAAFAIPARDGLLPRVTRLPMPRAVAIATGLQFLRGGGGGQGHDERVLGGAEFRGGWLGGFGRGWFGGSNGRRFGCGGGRRRGGSAGGKRQRENHEQSEEDRKSLGHFFFS